MYILKSSELSGYFELLTAAHEAFQDLVSSLISFPARVPTPLLCSGKVCHTVPHICVLTYVAVSSQNVLFIFFSPPNIIPTPSNLSLSISYLRFFWP